MKIGIYYLYIKAVSPPKSSKFGDARSKIKENRAKLSTEIHCRIFVLWTNLANHYSQTFYGHVYEVVNNQDMYIIQILRLIIGATSKVY